MEKALAEGPAAQLISNEERFALNGAHEYEEAVRDSYEPCRICGIAWHLHPYLTDPAMLDPEE